MTLVLDSIVFVFESLNEDISGMLLFLLLLMEKDFDQYQEAMKEADSIVNHPIHKQEGFKRSLFSKELQSFIRLYCNSADAIKPSNHPEVTKKLFVRGVYRRVIDLLDELNLQLDNKEGTYLNVVHSYEKKLQLLYRLSEIARMRHKVSLTLNKVTGISYMALSYYSGFLAKFTHEKRNFRILKRLDAYASKSDPKIYEDAENKYFEESLEAYDKDNAKSKELDNFKLF